MNDHQQQFPMSFPVMFPFSPPQAPPRMDVPPARVRTALEYLSHTMVKGLTRAAVNDISIELIPGQGLTTAEANAQASACNMLSDYFQGKVMARPPRRRKKSKGDGFVLSCPVCSARGQLRPTCKVCKGSGAVVAYPVDKDSTGAMV